MCADPSPELGLCLKVVLDRDLLALAGHHLEKVEKVDLLEKFCQYFQYITVPLATKFVIPAANIPLVLFQPCLLFHFHLFSLHSCTPISLLLLPTKVQKEIPPLITLLMFSLYTHSLCCFLVLKLLSLLSAWQLWSEDVGSLKPEFVLFILCCAEWLALRSELQASKCGPTEGGPKPPTLPTAKHRQASGTAQPCPCCPNSWPHAAGMERWCG